MQISQPWLYDRFQNTVLFQWPRIPYVYWRPVGLYTTSLSLTLYSDTCTTSPCPFNPNVNRIPEPRIPTCDSCKKASTRYLFPYLSPSFTVLWKERWTATLIRNIGVWPVQWTNIHVTLEPMPCILDRWKLSWNKLRITPPVMKMNLQLPTWLYDGQPLGSHRTILTYALSHIFYYPIVRVNREAPPNWYHHISR
jgi:hypothetical protein